MKFIIKSIVLVLLFVTSATYAGEKKEKGAIKSSLELKKVVKEELLQKGETVYNSYCMACHMSEGQGVSSLNPPLTRTKYTLGDKKAMIEIVINGMEGEIEVLGEKYNGFMNPFSFLSDEEIADVVTYIRSSFGNDGDAATKEEVAAVRSSLE